VDQVLDCFTPDAIYTDLFYGQFRDRAGLRALFERMFTEGEAHEWMRTRVVEQPDCTIGEWSFAFTVSAVVPASRGRTLSFRGISVFETRGGLCHTYRECFDRGAALFALGIPPHTVWRHPHPATFGGGEQPRISDASGMTGHVYGLLIGDFARRCRLPVSTLRYYDQIGLLTPAVVDPVSGYRRYTLEQLDAAVMIARLRAIGTTPQTIAAVLAGGASAQAGLVGERRRIQAQIRADQQALEQIEDLFSPTDRQVHHHVSFVDLAAERVTALPIASAQDELASAVLRGVATLRSLLRRAGHTPTPPWGATLPLLLTEQVHGFVFTRTTSAVEHPDITSIRRPATPAAQTLHHGSPDTLWTAYQATLDLIDHRGRQPTGPVIEEYLALGTPKPTTPRFA